MAPKEEPQPMHLMLVAGRAHPALAAAIAAELRTELARRDIATFPDGELHIDIQDSARGRDVYLVQPTGPPVETHLLELLLLADACRRAGAARLTAVMPYFGYARQDRRTGRRTPVGGRLVADLLGAGALDRAVVVDLHAAAVEGFFSIPVEHLTAVPLLARVAQPWIASNTVLVAPDLGAVKLAERYARLLDLPVATVHKQRISGSEVQVREIVGDVQDRAPLVVDDMLSTGGTVAAALRALLEAGCVPRATVAVTHGLFVGDAETTLRALPIERLLTTDSLPQRTEHGLPLAVAGVAPLLAEAIKRLHFDETFSGLRTPG
jgi:ribose-phosphate pyrophosphokinase